MGTDVAVDDIERVSVFVGLGVSHVETGADARTDIDGVRHGDGSSLLGHGLDDLGDVRAMDILHGDIIAVIDATQVIDLGNIVVVDANDDAGLVDEHGDKLIVFGEVGEDFFDGHRFFEAPDAGHGGTIDLGHAPTSDQLMEGVLAKLLRQLNSHESTVRGIVGAVDGGLWETSLQVP